MRKLSTTDTNFPQQLNSLLAWQPNQDTAVESQVKKVIEAIRNNGDDALLEFTERWDHWRPDHAGLLEIPHEECKRGLASIPADLRYALGQAADRIEQFHRAQLKQQHSWSMEDAMGCELGQRINAIDRAGLYVPGGKAAYPSSVLMNAIPAKVAGVKELIVVTPTPRGEINPAVLAACAIAKVDRVFRIGGAQAVAALAYGTATIPRVDKITGPGNAYVAEAKRQVFGQVGIDMIAGPSEIVVICDGKTPVDWVVMDLFSQAEHDEDAQAILICPDAAFILEVETAIERLLPTMTRAEIIQAALQKRGAIILAVDLVEACKVSNRIAPEHLELSVEHAESYLKLITHAGAIFIGSYTSESLGDYCAGPNHVLPTSGTARFASALGVYDFQKRTSIVRVSHSAALTLGPIAAKIADHEGLTAHAEAARLRKT